MVFAHLCECKAAHMLTSNLMRSAKQSARLGLEDVRHLRPRSAARPRRRQASAASKFCKASKTSGICGLSSHGRASKTSGISEFSSAATWPSRWRRLRACSGGHVVRLLTEHLCAGFAPARPSGHASPDARDAGERLGAKGGNGSQHPHSPSLISTGVRSQHPR